MPKFKKFETADRGPVWINLEHVSYAIGHHPLEDQSQTALHLNTGKTGSHTIVVLGAALKIGPTLVENNG